VAVETLAVPALPAGRGVTNLAVLGDSIAVGLGDPLPDGGWRGFGPLLAAALGAAGEVRYTNLSFIGARMGACGTGSCPARWRRGPTSR
jgi:lysophospholipase L1-like esterase